MEVHAAQEERHEQGKRRAKLEAGFAEVALDCHKLQPHGAMQDCCTHCIASCGSLCLCLSQRSGVH